VRNYAPNLTLLASRYSDEQFLQAIKQGVRPSDGRALWGMPSQIFAYMPEDHLATILAFIRTRPAGGDDRDARPPSLLSRAALIMNALDPSDPHAKAAVRPAPELVAYASSHPPIEAGAEYEAGRRWTRAVCAECHGSDLGGDATEGGPNLLVAAAYDAESFRKLLRTGVPMSGRDLGVMSEVARDDFRVFTDEEIESIRGYLVARSEALSRADPAR
jgi:mono/diheme cytochrome c family protein